MRRKKRMDGARWVQAFRTKRLLFFAADYGDRAEQAGGQQWRFGLVRLYVGIGNFGCAGLLVSDEAVDPGVGDLDDQLVGAGFERGGSIDAVRRVPHDAEALAVDDDFGKVLDTAQIDPEMRAGLEPIGRGLYGLGIRAGAGVVLDAGVGVVAPGCERVEGDGGRRAEVGFEADGP